MPIYCYVGTYCHRPRPSAEGVFSGRLPRTDHHARLPDNPNVHRLNDTRQVVLTDC
ncbi:hypothetical protein LG302_14715 [Halomonas organivorans]